MTHDIEPMFTVGVNGDIVYLDDRVRLDVIRNGDSVTVEGEVVEIFSNGTHFIVQLDDGDIIYASVSQLQPNQET